MNIKKDLDQILKDFQKNYPAGMFKDKKIYGDWLAQTYYFVCHSTPLLGFALPHLKNQALKHHFEHHMSEEQKHELLAQKDIEKLGMDVTNFKEYSSTQAFYHSQYFRIQFEGGTALLGYILFLEAMAVSWGREIYNEVKDQHKGSSLFIKVHAEEDPTHLDNALRAIMALSEDEQAAILRNLHFANDMYQRMMQDILSKKALVRAA